MELKPRLGEAREDAAGILRPILDMYMDAPVALIGCHSAGIQRKSCELDVLVVTDELRPPASVKLGGVDVDLLFISREEALKPLRSEFSASMAHARPIRDASLLISTSIAASGAILTDSCRRSSRGRLASALKALGRVDAARQAKRGFEADFWLIVAAYDYAYALLYSKEVLPRPSHLLQQVKDETKGTARSFVAFSDAGGLGQSSRVSCASRLEGVSIVHDLLRRGAGGDPAEGSWSAARTEIVRTKARELNEGLEHAECYSYLGQELAASLLSLAARRGVHPANRPRSYSPLSSLFSGRDQLLSERLADEAGLRRPMSSIVASGAVLREQVSRLARKG